MPAGPRPARRRRRPAATRRGGGSRAPAAARRPGSDAERPAELRLGHPELGRAAPHREVRVGLRRDVRVEPEQDVQRRAVPRRAPGHRPARAATVPAPRAPRGSRRPPSAAGCPSAAARTAARRSAVDLPIALQRDPGVRHARRPGRGPLAGRDHVGVQARGREPRDDRGHVVRLDGERAQPRVGERGTELRGRLLERGDGRDVDRRAEPARGADQEARARAVSPCSRPGRLSQGRSAPRARSGSRARSRPRTRR